MSRRGRRAALAGAALALAVVLLAPAAADWLVTREGDRIETAGPWKVENRLVVFERPDGTYASIRLSEIDLEASERLTRELAARSRSPEPAAEPEPRPVIARLTEKDLPPVGRPEGPAERPTEETGAGVAGTGASGGGEEAATEGEPEALQIVTWRELGGPERDGLELVGEVRNLTEHTALGVAVTVVLLDEEGEETATSQALLTTSVLPPGGTAGFRASFPGTFHYAGVQFRSTAEMAVTVSPPERGADGPPARR